MPIGMLLESLAAASPFVLLGTAAAAGAAAVRVALWHDDARPARRGGARR